MIPIQLYLRPDSKLTAIETLERTAQISGWHTALDTLPTMLINALKRDLTIPYVLHRRELLDGQVTTSHIDSQRLKDHRKRALNLEAIPLTVAGFVGVAVYYGSAGGSGYLYYNALGDVDLVADPDEDA